MPRSIATLVLGNLLQDFMLDTAAVYEDRVWIWEHYGTAYRAALSAIQVTCLLLPHALPTLEAMYTLFEITFAGRLSVILLTSTGFDD